MLTVEHVRFRRSKGQLQIVPRCGASVDRAHELLDEALALARAHHGSTRGDLASALQALPTQDGEVLLGRAVAKLVLDRCDFQECDDVDVAALRREVFREAARERALGAFDRERVLGAAGAEFSLSAGQAADLLFSDIKDAHRVDASALPNVDELMGDWELAELQAVFLRASTLTVDVTGAPAQLRALLPALKFPQLMFVLLPSTSVDTLRLSIDGPLRPFCLPHRYGLKLALLLPSLVAYPRYRVEAAVQVKKTRAQEQFILAGTGHGAPPETAASSTVERLFEDLTRAAGRDVSIERAATILPLPGVGAVVPDLLLTHESTGSICYIEVLGFWSRAAVWQRVELVEQGLLDPVIFCVSDKLRVSEAALKDTAPACLLAFKGVVSAARILEKFKQFQQVGSWSPVPAPSPPARFDEPGNSPASDAQSRLGRGARALPAQRVARPNAKGT